MGFMAKGILFRILTILRNLFGYICSRYGKIQHGQSLSLIMGDYHILHEMLRNVDGEKLDFYIETPGGSGEAAEEIVEFLHSKFETIDFVIAGEARTLVP